MKERREALSALGDRLKNRRTHLGLSQEQMADRCGVHRTYYSAIERGERNVTVLVLLTIARGVEVDPGELLAGL